MTKIVVGKDKTVKEPKSGKRGRNRDSIGDLDLKQPKRRDPSKPSTKTISKDPVPLEKPEDIPLPPDPKTRVTKKKSKAALGTEVLPVKKITGKTQLPDRPKAPKGSKRDLELPEPKVPKSIIPRENTSNKLGNEDRKRITKDDCSLYLGVSQTWKDHSPRFWTALQRHVSDVFLKYPTELGGLTEVLLSGTSFLLLTFETTSWRNKYLEISPKLPFFYNVGTEVKTVPLHTTRFGQKHFDTRTWTVTAPGTTGQRVGDALQGYFEKSCVAHPGYSVHQVFSFNLPTARYFIRFAGPPPPLVLALDIPAVSEEITSRNVYQEGRACALCYSKTHNSEDCSSDGGATLSAEQEGLKWGAVTQETLDLEEVAASSDIGS